MRTEPSIVYSFKKYPKQQSYECVANSLAILIEKLFELEGETFKVDPNELDDKIRFHQNKKIDKEDDGSEQGVNSLEALRMLKKYGYKGKRFKYQPIKKGIFNIRYFLGNIYNRFKPSGSPLYVTIRYGKRSKDSYTVGKKAHAVCCFGWDAPSSSLLVIDPYNPTKLYKCPLEVVKDIYRLRIRN